MHPLDFIVCERQILLVRPARQLPALGILNASRRIALYPLVTHAILEERLQHRHTSNGCLRTEWPARAELPNIDRLPLVDHCVTALFRKFV